MDRIALITGITGQDGSYLAELLIEEGYKVVGIRRRASTTNTGRLTKEILNSGRLELIESDITDATHINFLLLNYRPELIFNLAAQSHVMTSFDVPSYTMGVTGLAPLNFLESIRRNKLDTTFYQASSSEMFGNSVSMEYDIQGVCTKGNFIYPDVKKFYYYDSRDIPYYESREHIFRFAESDDDEDEGLFQNEETPFSPCSPYAVAKLAAHNLVRVYRESYGIRACSGILFNHESPRRGDNFVTKKIVNYIKKIKEHPLYGVLSVSELLEQDLPKLKLGNLYAKRDWGHAKDYVRAMYMMVKYSGTTDYVVGSDETHTVLDFFTKALEVCNIDVNDPLDLIEIDDTLKRPMEVPFLRSNSAKIRKELGWWPEYSFKKLIEDMCI